MKVCYFGTYRAEYSRNRIMIEGLRRNGVTVTECHVALWRGIEDRVASVAGGWKRPEFWWRIATTYVRLILQFWSLRNSFDVLICGYPGQFDVYLARILSWWTHKPLVWDIFMSIYLIALERDLHHKNPAVVSCLRFIEQHACRLPDRLILDTTDYVAWFERVHGIPTERFRLVPTGADSDLFQPLPLRNAKATPLHIVYYGTFIRNHDVLTIIEAAHILAEYEMFRFTLIGDGPDRVAAVQRAKALGLTNVKFVDWTQQSKLIEMVADADICLGAFGDTSQSKMTIQNKIYEGMAMQRAVITGDSPAIRSAMSYGWEILLCDRHNPVALAQAIRMVGIDSDLRIRLALQGRSLFEREFSIPKIGALYRCHLDALWRDVDNQHRSVASDT